MPDITRIAILLIVAILGGITVAPQLEKRFEPKALTRFLLIVAVSLAILIVGFAVFMAINQ